MTFLATWPFLKRISVGIERTSKFAAVCWLSSTFSFTMRRSSRSEAISSRTGPTTRHGPHQGAQKSTSTGWSDSMTSAWKLVSVTSVMLPAIGSPRCSWSGPGRPTIQSVVPGWAPPSSVSRGGQFHEPRPHEDLDVRGHQEDRDRDQRGRDGGGQQLV